MLHTKEKVKVKDRLTPEALWWTKMAFAILGRFM
jgi:hypothetical protein